MPPVLVLTEGDLRAAVGLDRDELAAIEAVYPLLSAGVGSVPPIMRIDVPEHDGEIDVKSAYLPGYAGIAVKVSAGFFANPRKGLPSLGGLMIVLDATTGVPQAALFDNGYLTDLRTGLAGAVAADHLAVAGATDVGIIGAGVQARLQLEALRLVRPLERVRVWARRADRASAFAREAADRLGLDVRAVASPEDAAVDADVLVTTTPATEPVVDARALHPGLHITAVGSDAEHKQELHADVLAGADVVVCDAIAQSRRLGELRSMTVDGRAGRREVVELGDVIAGRVPGRGSRDDITVCDLTGTGAQDTAIATLAVRRCLGAGAGTRVDT